MASKEDHIRELLDIMEVNPSGMSELFKDRMSKVVLPSVPGNKKEEAEKFLNDFFADDPFGSRITNAHVKAYDSRFSHIEIKELLGFYETPIGRRWVEAVGEITKDVLKANKKIVGDLIDEAHRGLREAGIIPKDKEAEAAKDRILAGVAKRLSN